MNDCGTIEDVLYTSVRIKINVCFLCRSDEGAKRIQREVTSGQCVLLWLTEERAFIAELKLTDVDQVQHYARDFRSLCQRHQAEVACVRFTVGDESQDFSVDQLLSA